MVVPGTVSGNPAASAALRPTFTGLVADLHDAAHDHVVDERGVEVVALDEGPQRVGGEVDGVPARQAAVRRPSGVRTASTITARLQGGCGARHVRFLAGRPAVPAVVRRHVLRAGACPVQGSTRPRSAAFPPVRCAPMPRDMHRSLGDGGMPLLGQLGLSFDGYGEGWAEARVGADEPRLQPGRHRPRRGLRRDPRCRHELRRQQRARVGRRVRPPSTCSTRRCERAQAGDALPVRGEVVRVTRAGRVRPSRPSATPTVSSSREATSTCLLRRRDP